MQIERLLQQQGFGTRKTCRALVRCGRFSIHGAVADDPFLDIDPEGLVFTVDGQQWPYFEKASILLNKPAGFECSRNPKHHPGIHSLLPPQFSARNMQCVGRLDVDTTGLLIITDDGALIHALSSPKRKIPKCYRVTTCHPIQETQIAMLRSGVRLHDDPDLPLAADVRLIEERVLLLTITQGRYHQVKRMIAAAGNRVDALCRVSAGGLHLPPDLPEGQWRWLTAPQLLSLFNPAEKK